MPLYTDRLYATSSGQSTSSVTEYRTCYMSPRREDYIPHVALPKIGTARPPAHSRSFVSYDIDPNFMSKTSEYRLGFPNHRPKRPYVFQAQPTHIFDPLPTPNNSKDSSRLDLSSSYMKASEYQDRFSNYRSYLPIKESVPSHSNLLSDAKLKKDRMTRSQYFHELITESDQSNGGQRYIGNSEQRTAFQWPSHVQQEPIHREVLNTSI